MSQNKYPNAKIAISI